MTGRDPLFVTLALLYGPVPGVELIPYFLGLLAWAGLAIAAVLLAPLRALIRRLRKIRGNPPPVPMSESTTPESVHAEVPVSVPESPSDGNRDRV